MFLRRESCSFLKVGVRKAPDLRQMLQTVKKPTFVLRMGSGNEAFPEWNPQGRDCALCRGVWRVSRLFRRKSRWNSHSFLITTHSIYVDTI